MKINLFVILLTVQIVLLSCSDSKSGKSIEDKIKIEDDLVYYGLAATSMKLGTNPANSGIVENSIISENGKLINIYDEGFNGTLTFGTSNASDYFKTISVVRLRSKIRNPSAAGRVSRQTNIRRLNKICIAVTPHFVELSTGRDLIRIAGCS